MSLARREILKATLIGLLIACAILGAFVLSVVLLKGEYTIDADKFDADVEWGENVSLEGIEIIDNRTLGLVTTPLTRDMVVSIDDTEQAGRKKIVFVHNNREFTVYFDVKYKVEFLSYGEIIDTQRVFGKDELVPPVAKPKTGYEFSHWDVDLSEELTGNIQVNAVFKEIEYPSLQGITATYGDTLGDITLPSNKYGQWEFIYPADTPVGNAGRQSYSVRFAFYEDENYFKYGFVDIAVSKKQLEFTDIKDIFVYDGNEHFPTYSISEDVDVMVITSGSANTEAGVYEYSFEIVDANYAGIFSGTYEIQKPTVTVKVSSATVTYPAAVPTFTYEVEGFENVELLGIKINAPAFASQAGVFEIGITYTNENVNYDIHNGTLTVLKGDLPVDAPEISVATFEDKLSDISFVGKYLGVWAWENPDQIIDDMEKVVAYAIFTHDDPNLNPVRMAIEITGIQKKTLSFNVTGSTFTYAPGTEHKLTYEIVGGLYPDLYKTLTVVGNDPAINAGTYRRTLIINDYRYEGSTTVELKITPATPVTDFTKVYEVIWNENLLLSSIALPEGYAWKNPGERISGAGEHTFAVIYTPVDTANYVSVNGEIKVIVAKSAVDVAGVLSEYTKIYDTFEYNIKNSGIYARYTDGALTIKYYKDGVEVDKIVNAGTYMLVITVEEGSNYLGTTIERTVIVERAENTQTVQTSQTATYLDSLSVLRLPPDNEGTWSWLETEIGTAGTKIFAAIYTPDANANYLPRTVFVEVTVLKKEVSAPSYPAVLLYTGLLQNLRLRDTDLYTVSDAGGINNGDYVATLTLRDPANYKWTANDEADIELGYRIVSVENAWVVNPSISGWTYGDEPAEPNAKAKYGSYRVEYYDADMNLLSEVPTNAGTYYARFISTDTNCTTVTQDVRFVIAKRAVTTIPTLSSTTFVYTGSNQKPTVSGADQTLYTVTNDGGVNVGSYNVTLTLIDPANYRWSDVSGDTKNLGYSITKATAQITDLAINGWIFGTTANAPSANTTFGNITYVYSTEINGTYTGAVPTAAGTYYVKARVANSSNYNGNESAPVSFTIAKASASITGLSATYVTTYNGGAFVVTGIGRSHNESTLVYKINGVVVETISVTNAGTYNVEVILPESANYLEATATATITVNKADTTDVVTTTQNSTYLNKLSTLTLPTSTIGTWTWKDADENTTVGNAGTNTFVAVFTPSAENANNYNSMEVEVTVNVAKKAINVPTVGDKTYNNTNLTSGLTNTADYNVTTDLGGTTVGTYYVTLTLTDFANHIWQGSDGTSADTVISYKINKATNVWQTAPSIGDWTYNETASAPSALLTYGDYVVEYKKLGADDSTYTTTVPTLAGDYVARFSGKDTHNCNTTPVTVEFTIEKADADITNIKDAEDYVFEFDFADVDVTAGIGVSHSETSTITFTYSRDGVSVTKIYEPGTYTVTVNATESANYKSAVATFTVVVNKIANRDTVGDDILNQNAIYGDSKSVIILPANTDSTGVWSVVENVQTVGNAGKNTFTLKFTPNNPNYYSERTVTIEVDVAKQPVTVPTIADKVYTGVHIPSGLTTNTRYKVSEGTSNINVDTYEVELELLDSSNYVWSNGATLTTTVTYNITKAKNTDVVGPYKATYGDLLSSITLPTAKEGAWSWNAATNLTVGDAGVKTFTAIYTCSTGNYEDREVTVQVTVDRKALDTTPTLVKDSFTFGETIDLGISSNTYYTVTDNGTGTAGTHTVTVTPTSNYKWPDGTITALTLSYEIRKAGNTDTVDTTQEATYGDMLSTLVLPAVSEKGSWSWKNVGSPETTPVGNAGEHTRIALFTPANSNYEYEEVEVTIIVSKKPVNAPTLSQNEFTYVKGLVQAPTVVDNDATNKSYYSILFENENSTNAATYKVTLTLNNPNYMWDDTQGDTATRTLTYTIKKASASIIVADGALSQGRDYDKTVYTIEGITPSHTETDLVYSIDLATIKNAGTYTVVISLPECDNYEAAASTVTVTVTIGKAKVPVPSIDKNTFTYDTNNHKPTVINPDTELYDVNNTGNINAGSYNVELTLKDSANYKWDVTGEGSDTYNIPYTIQTASIAGLTISLNKNNWFYNEAYAQITTAKTSAFGEIKVLYSTDGTSWSETQPTDAGTYYVKAVVYADTNATPNWSYAETAKETFTIKRIVVDMPTLSGNSFTFNNGTQAPTVVDDSATNRTYYTYAFSNASSKDAGSYTVTFSLINENGVLNYEWEDGTTADFSIEYTIASYVPTLSVSISNWTYNGSYANPTYSIVNCPTFLEGKTLRVVYTQGETTLTSAPKDNGTYTVTVYLDAEDSSETPDWTVASASATFTISKVIVHKPIEEIVRPYTGEHVGCGITSEYYNVYDGNNNINVGEYDVRFELKDKTNYVWDDAENTTADYETKYRISATANDWTTNPYVTGKDYDGNPVSYGAVAQHGGYSVTFWGQDGEGNYTLNLGNTAPSAAGSYKAVFVTTDTNHEVKTETVTFTIGKASVTAPTLSWTEPAIFNGSAQAPTLENTTDSDKYTTSAIVAYINQGSYDVTVTLKDTANYKWSGTDSSDAITLTYTIDPITFTLSVSVGAWTYNDASTGKVTYSGIPSCVTGKVTVEFKQRLADDSTYSTTVPTAAGNYTVRVTVAGSVDGNWAEQSKTVNFSIDKLGIALPTLSADEFTYSYGVVQKPTVNGADDTTLYKTPVFSNASSTDVGAYSVTFGLVYPDNYKWIGGDSADVTVSYNIKKANAAITVQKTEIGVVYNTTAFDPLTLAGATENNTDIDSLTWRISKYVNTLRNEEAATSILNAGTYTVVISLAGSANYNAATDIEVIVTVDKATVERPVIADREFTNAEMTSGLSSDLYSVVEKSTDNKNVGTYYAELTLTDPANYKWAEAAVATFSLRNTHIIEVPYKIVTKQSAITDLDASGWIYGALTNAATSTPNHTFASVEYYYSTTKDGEYTTNKPTDADTYYVKAVIPADTVNNNWSRAESEPLMFTIAKADPTIEVGNWNQTHIYNKGEYTIGSVTTNNTETDLIFTIISYAKPDGTAGSVPADNKIVNAGTYTVKVSIAESANYNAKTLEDKITVTISKDKASFTVNQNQSTEFNNAVYDVLGTVTVNKGELAPTFVITEYKNSLGEAVDEENLPESIINAGTYKLTISLGESDNYTAADPVDVTVIITKASVIAPSIKDGQTSFKYDGTKHVPELEKLTDSSLYTVTNSGATNCGTYYVKVELKNTNNYEWQDTESSAALSLKFNVTKATYEITVNVSAWTFGDDNTNNSKVVVTGIPTYVNDGKYTVEYKVKGANDDTYSTTAPTNAGDYTVRITVAADDPETGNWDGVSVEKDFTIGKKSVVITFKGNLYLTYNRVSYKSEVLGALKADNGATNFMLTDRDGNAVDVMNAGTYLLKASLDETANYSSAYVEFEVEVKKLTTTVDITIADKAFDSNAVTYTTIDNNQFADPVVTFYAKTGVDSEGNEVYSSVALPSAPSATGKYKVVASIATDSNWIGASVEKTFTIGKASSEITGLKANTFTYADMDYLSEVQSGVKVMSGDTEVTGASITWSVNGVLNGEIKNYGTYTVTASFEGDDNHEPSSATVTVTVNKANTSISGLKADTFTYANTDYLSTVKNGVVVKRGDTEVTGVTITWSVDEIKNAGSYTVKASFAGDSNHNPSEATVTISVAKAPASINNIPVSKKFTFTYNDVDYYGNVKDGIEASNGVTLQWSITSFTKFDGTAGNADGKIIGAGDYVISIVLPETDNYLGASDTVTVTVKKADAVISGFTASGWTYGDAPITPTVTPTFDTVRFVYSTTGGDDDYVDLTEFLKTHGTNNHLNAGTYYVKAIVDGTDNYNGSESAISFTVAKREVSKPSLEIPYYTGGELIPSFKTPIETDYVEIISVSEEESDEPSIDVAIEVGEVLRVYVSLIDKENCVWAEDKTIDDVMLYVEVQHAKTNGWESDEAPTVFYDNPSGFKENVNNVYGGTITITEGTSKFDNDNGRFVGYKVSGSEDDYTEIKLQDGEYQWPTLPVGTYEIIVKTNPRNSVVAAEERITIVIAPQPVTIPSLFTPTYNGEKHTATLATTSPLYSVVANSATKGTNANVKLSLTVTLNNKTNYVWSDGTTDNKTITTTIKLATVTITGISVNNGATITYGDTISVGHTLKTESFSTAHNTVVEYSMTGLDGTWSTDITTLYTNGSLYAGITYHVRVTVTDSTKDSEGNAITNWTADPKTTTFTVDKASITLPTQSGTLTYNGESQTAEFTGNDSDKYTIGDASAVNAGTHKATVTIKDEYFVNYKWSTTAVQSTTVEFTIGKAELGNVSNIKVEAGTINFSDTVKKDHFSVKDAKGNPIKVEYSIQFSREDLTDANGSVIYYATYEELLAAISDAIEIESVVNGETVTRRYLPKNDTYAYLVKVTINDSNYSDATGIVKVTTFNISPAEPTEISNADVVWSGNVSNGGQYYQNLLTMNKTGTKVYYVNNDGVKVLVAGTFSDPVLDANGFQGSNTGYDIAFTSSDGSRFINASFNVKANLKVVATIGNITDTSKYEFADVKGANGNVTTRANAFGTIEDALGKAVSGDTVWVVADNTGYVQIKGNTVTQDDVTKQQLTIPSGVTLNLPYAAFSITYTDSDGVSHTIDVPAGVNEVADDGSIAAVWFDRKNPMGADAIATEEYCTTKVVLCENVELVVLGDLMIAGQLDGGNASRKYSGQTSGYHARFVLEAGSNVIVYGEMHVPGFIIDGENGTGSITVKSGGKIYQPMVIRDFKGGTFTSFVYAQWLDPTGYLGGPVSPFNEIGFLNIGPKVTIEYGGNALNYANLNAGGKVSSAVADMIGSTVSSFIQLYQNAYVEFDYDFNTNILDLHFFGGAKTNVFTVEVMVGDSPQSASSTQFVFPLSWMYNITLDVIPGNTATYDMPDRFKLMPGGKMTIANGATLNIDELYVYDTSYNDGNTVSTKYPENYSERDTTLTGALPNAKLIVNGTLSADVLSGNVWSTNPNGAHVTATTASSAVKEASGNGSSNTSYKFTLKFLFEGKSDVTPSGNSDVEYKTEGGSWVAIKAGGSSGGNPCVTPDTLITLADGTQKRVDELTYDDKILAWNLFKGEYEITSAAYIVKHDATERIVITLYFSDETYVKVVGYHGFFNMDKNKFVFIDDSNVESYVGDDFVKQNGLYYETVTLVSYNIATEFTESYSLASIACNNVIANGLFSLTPIENIDSEAFFDFIVMGDDMKYDEQALQADVEKYGLFTYEDLSDYMTEEEFAAFEYSNGCYLKIAVGKGLITLEKILIMMSPPDLVQ